MGTSKSRSTPSGGEWTPLKNNLTSYLGGNKRISALKMVGQTIRATGGFTGGGGGGGGGGRGGRRGLGGTIGGLGGFANTLSRDGLDAALDQLRLSELHGKDAPEVIAKVAEHLCEASDGDDHEVMTDAIRNAILEAADLGNELGYDDLEAGLQNYLQNEGVEGLIELFLGRFAYEFVWSRDEQHIEAHSANAGDTEALRDAFLHACKSEVRNVISDAKSDGSFANVNWFDKDGIRLGQEIAAKVESRLVSHAND